jgi:4-hydroxybenzoate polyprenyltransferase
MVGTSPERRTKTDIREKKKAARRIKRIPFLLLLILFSALIVPDMFFEFACPAVVIALMFSLLQRLTIPCQIIHDSFTSLALLYNTFASRQFPKSISCRKTG